MQRKIALIGFGTVGRAFYNQLRGMPGFRLSDIIVRNGNKPRPAQVNGLLSTQLDRVLNDAQIGIVAEAIDDPAAALLIARETLTAGKIYISANKRMLANNLAELVSLLQHPGARLYYEAAVGGAIPILRVLGDYFKGKEILSIRGIINGSTNYILSSMHDYDSDYGQALSAARKLGYAESDPTFDVEGFDPVYKTVLLAREAFGILMTPSMVKRQGITAISAGDIAAAKNDGGKLKLVASIESRGSAVIAEVKPEVVFPGDPLFNTDGVMNAIVISGRYSGDIVLQGEGAGGRPTASAMMADLQKAAERSMTFFAAEETFRCN